MTYLVSAGRDEPRQIADVDDLDALLDALAARAELSGPLVVGIYRQDGEHWLGMDLGIGHPERSFLFATGDDGGYGCEQGVEPWPADIVFDYGGTPTDYHPEETRVRPATARQAARELVASGQLPSSVRWEGDGGVPA
jgi:hypothetical protein